MNRAQFTQFVTKEVLYIVADIVDDLFRRYQEATEEEYVFKRRILLVLFQDSYFTLHVFSFCLVFPSLMCIFVYAITGST